MTIDGHNVDMYYGMLYFNFVLCILHVIRDRCLDRYIAKCLLHFIVMHIADTLVFDSVYRWSGSRENFDRSCSYRKVCHK